MKFLKGMIIDSYSSSSAVCFTSVPKFSTFSRLELKPVPFSFLTGVSTVEFVSFVRLFSTLELLRERLSSLDDMERCWLWDELLSMMGFWFSSFPCLVLSKQLIVNSFASLSIWLSQFGSLCSSYFELSATTSPVRTNPYSFDRFSSSSATSLDDIMFSASFLVSIELNL